MVLYQKRTKKTFPKEDSDFTNTEILHKQNKNVISIVLAAYNGSNYIKDQLNSFVHQTIQPNELIICDDLSSDNTVNIINNK